MKLGRMLRSLTVVALAAGLSTVPATTMGATSGAACVSTAAPDESVARMWDEVLLDAIRRDFPAPTVHSRNLYHLSAAMWDAWASYDPVADGVFVTVKRDADDVATARDRAISYAAYRLLSHRYGKSAGAKESVAEFGKLMDSLCYPRKATSTKGDGPTALGNLIAKRIIRATMDDGSNERHAYKPPHYAPMNEPLIVQLPGTQQAKPNHWQPLALEVSYTQNGLPQPVGPQHAVGPHWGHVTSFALPPSDTGVPIDPGPPPFLHDPVTDQDFKASAVTLATYSSLLDPDSGIMIDISPGALGNNPLGTNDGKGRPRNPVTSEPYTPEWVRLGDFGRVVAEFWADGPASETPPGHWNTLANAVVDSPHFERRIGGVGDELDPLEWDVKMYLALNGAVHDAAIAAWGLKGFYDYTRPISMIRYMGGKGQSSDPDGPSYDPDGLPLVPGEVEVITAESSAPGERHEHLADHVGEIAIRAWQGNPEDPETQVGGVGWIRAVDWVPYQKPTFVTPAFPAYVSGHSSFSRAAAEVLTAMTGSEYFPGGLGTWTIPAGGLAFEAGPPQDIVLEWATYFDASDQAGVSRLYGGIHVPADDFNGRRIGSECGRMAWAKAQTFYDGTARA